VDEELVGALVVGLFGQSGGGEGLIELPVEVEAPTVHFFPGDFAAADGEEAVAMLFDADRDEAVAQHDRAGEQQADEMHHMFPADAAVIAKVLLEFLELGKYVGVIGPMNVPG
jgi:hypothetical protein